MRYLIPLVLVLSPIVFSGCNNSPEKLSDGFKTQLLSLIQSASKLAAMSKDGVSYKDFADTLDDFKGQKDLADAMWPSDFCPEAKEALGVAQMGWVFTEKLWSAKISNSESTSVGIATLNGEKQTFFSAKENYYDPMPEDFKQLIPTFVSRTTLEEVEELKKLMKKNGSKFPGPGNEWMLDEKNLQDVSFSFDNIGRSLAYSSDKFEAARKDFLPFLN